MTIELASRETIHLNVAKNYNTELALLAVTDQENDNALVAMSKTEVYELITKLQQLHNEMK